MLRVFVGFDERESIGLHVYLQSMIEHTSAPFSMSALGAWRAGGKQGSNAFTYSRFGVPADCGWSGFAIFVDGSDMLLRDDLYKLAQLFDGRYAVQVVKHDYRTKHPRKYLGTPMESPNIDYPCKNWSSVMIWNCGHLSNFDHRDEIEEAMQLGDGSFLHRFGWLERDEIGELPAEWNHLVGEQDPNPSAKIAHFTLGIPSFPAYSECEHSSEWREVLERSQRGLHVR